MAGYKMNRFKDLLKATGIVLLISVSSILIYDIYMNIEVESYGEEEIKVSRTSQLVEQEESSKQNISDIIENVSDAIVGISKLQNKGISIFSNESTEQLGLGSGVILSEDGYILSNQHVSGDKYSSCYITTSDGKEYTGTVMWADENVDLSIIKIKATNLTSVTLGNSESIRIGEAVYAIRKSNRI